MCPGALTENEGAPSSKLSRFGLFLSVEFSSAWEVLLSTSSCFRLLPEALLVSDVGIFGELGPASGGRALMGIALGPRGAERTRSQSDSDSRTTLVCDSGGGNGNEA